MNIDSAQLFSELWKIQEVACNAVLNNWPLKYVIRDLENTFPGQDLVRLREVVTKNFKEMVQLDVAEFFMHDAQGNPIFLNTQEALDVIEKDSSWEMDGIYVAPVPMGDRAYFRDAIQKFASLREAGARSNSSLNPDPSGGLA